MLVSHTHKFIYLKTRKTGGTSTEIYFQPACQPADVEIMHFCDMAIHPEGIVGARRSVKPDQSDCPTFYNHIAAAKLKDLLPTHQWDGYFKFTNVRNPFSLALSYFLHFGVAAQGLASTFNEASAQFRTFVQSGEHPDWQSQLLLGEKMAVDGVVRFESLLADSLALANQFGFVAPVQFSHYKERPWPFADHKRTDLYDDAAMAAVLNRDAWLFETFQYSTELPDV